MTCNRSWLAGFTSWWSHYHMRGRSIDLLLTIARANCWIMHCGCTWPAVRGWCRACLPSLCICAAAYDVLHITCTWSMNNFRKHAHRPYTVRTSTRHILAKVPALATWPIFFSGVLILARRIKLLQPQALKRRIDHELEPVFLTWHLLIIF